MQNLITLSFTADQISAIDQTLATLEQQLSGLITLSPSDKQRMPKLGDKYDTFCRHTLEALADTPNCCRPRWTWRPPSRTSAPATSCARG